MFQLVSMESTIIVYVHNNLYQWLSQNLDFSLDMLFVKLLSAADPVIAHPVAYIFNLYLQSGKFINEWKYAKVILLFKSGPAMERNNYRPILILSILSKVLSLYFSKNLEEFQILTVAQCGFRQLHFTVTALIQVTDCWLENIDNGCIY